MNKTKIDWCDMTWNPVTGCLHGCDYCYARRIAKRFGGYTIGGGYTEHEPLEGETGIIDEPFLIVRENDKVYQAPYPYDFKPTFHRYRLNEPQKVKKRSKIFVCSMADLFGAWVPDEWIEQVFETCKKASQHTYMFLTKNPYRYMQLALRGRLPNRENFWYGTTITENDRLPFNALEYKRNFISLEPLRGPVSEKFPFSNIGWVIIGQQTGPGAVPPKPEWVQSIIDQCRAAGVPVFVKSPLYEKFPIQEWPEGLRKEMGE
jgi:protein gp37